MLFHLIFLPHRGFINCQRYYKFRISRNILFSFFFDVTYDDKFFEATLQSLSVEGLLSRFSRVSKIKSKEKAIECNYVSMNFEQSRSAPALIRNFIFKSVISA